MALSRARRWAIWLAGGVVVVAALVVGGTYFYIHVISGPAPAALGLKSGAAASSSPAAARASSSTAAAGGAAAGSGGAVAGSWKVGTGSVVGYRVKEVLLGQNNVAVGRTSSVTGSLTISGTKVTAGSFTAQLATVKSDQSQRDAQFNGRIMDTAQYPTGILRLTSPIELAPVPAAGTVRVYHAVGQLTLHGHTRAVSFPLSAERTASGIEVSGTLPVVFAQYGIPNPSFGSFVTTASTGTLEFLIKFSHA
jgi:polyisoprenoid-binding protein YceI